MAENMPFFQVALNLPHAGRIARRILLLLPHQDSSADPLRNTALSLETLLAPYLDLDDNPGGNMAVKVRDQAAVLGRKLVDQIERQKASRSVTDHRHSASYDAKVSPRSRASQR